MYGERSHGRIYDTNRGRYGLCASAGIVRPGGDLTGEANYGHP